MTKADLSWKSKEMPSESPGKIVKNGYDRIYKQYDNYRKISVNRRELDGFLKLIPKGSRVLDIGCGSGRITKFLTDHDLNVVGIDISRNMLKLAEEKTPDAEFLKQDMRKLDFPKESFDGVWLCIQLSTFRENIIQRYSRRYIEY